MRKHEKQQPFFMDIFEPPPQWRTTVAHSNNGGGHAGYHAHSPTHRSPIHHQPSLSEIVYQDFNSHSDVQDAYPSVYQERRSQLQQQQRKSKQHHHYARADSAVETSEINDYESAASSLHTLSTSPHVNNRIEYNHQYEEDEDLDHYDDVEDNDSIDKRITVHRYQPDNISIATSLFTAVDHMEQLQPQEEDDDEDDSSSTENTRHGYLPTQQYEVTSLTKDVESVNTLIKKLDIQSTVQWEDYRPQYKLLNESYDIVKKEIYQEIYATMQKIQELDLKYNAAKLRFHLDMERNYEKMSNKLISQCNELSQEKEEYRKRIQNGTDETKSNMHQSQNEKVRLNVGGSMFETSLSTLRRDTDSLLATMFSGRHLITAESDGSYFIDRDPSHFRLVLNYLRDLRIPPTILQDNKIRQELLQEAKYYCIDGLVNLLQQ